MQEELTIDQLMAEISNYTGLDVSRSSTGYKQNNVRWTYKDTWGYLASYLGDDQLRTFLEMLHMVTHSAYLKGRDDEYDEFGKNGNFDNGN